MPTEEARSQMSMHPFRRAVLRGLGVVLPPLLTVVILLWIGSSVQKFVLSPVETLSRHALVWVMNKTRDQEFPQRNTVVWSRTGGQRRHLADGQRDPLESDGNSQDTEPANEPSPPGDSTSVKPAAPAATPSGQSSTSGQAGDGDQKLEADNGGADSADDGNPRDETTIQAPPQPAEPTIDERIESLLAKIDQRLGNPPTNPSELSQAEDETGFQFDSDFYVQLDNGEWLPEQIRDAVEADALQDGQPLPLTGVQFYHRYIQRRILRKTLVIPVFLAGFIMSMYLLGKFLAAGVGRILWNSMETVITQLPIIRTVYSSVKQVTDFFVGESDIDFKRVVAVEYPRKGMWSVGFVTGESMLSIRGACQDEPIVSILMPTSPVPGTGFTVSVRQSEVVDLDIPIEQALQFVVSCGVVIPDEELSSRIEAARAKQLASPSENVLN